ARMLRELTSLGEARVTCNTSSVPEFAKLNPEQCFLDWEIQLSGDIAEDAVKEVFEWVEGDAEISISQLNLSEAAPSLETLAGVSEAVAKLTESRGVEAPGVTVPAGKADAPKKETPRPLATESSSIRVGIDKIDNLVNLVGELVITQSMLGQLGNEFDMSRLAKLQEGLAQLEHNTRELQESVMRIRMLPISFAFNRFPRMVRDLSQKLQKKVELKLMGENTELDKTVMEKIGDPLVHLVRNSLDHGIEPPEERLAAGKPETGTVTLNAYHQGGNIVIEVIDDGKGLSPEKILAKAKQNGLITGTEILSVEQINDLIFLPGFSTAAEVTDISGRGVGMDVVRRNIQELNGSVEVRSVPGKGSTFSIRLPLTLAILDGQLVRVGDETYIVPLVSIIESMQIRNQLINHVAGGCDVFRLRNEYIPIISLHDVLGVKACTQNIEERLLVVVEWANEKVGMVVDDLLAQQQVVIKSLENNYQRVEGISGATILGDGTVSLIIDVQGIVRMAGQRHLERGGVVKLTTGQAA
ncbi:MAG TPA: chemotaxis protein CheA, partial [Pseudomonadales bacterium]|nr:chemotaxis protein CheA [Pseudomonadales bacterium]